MKAVACAALFLSLSACNGFKTAHRAGPAEQIPAGQEIFTKRSTLPKGAELLMSCRYSGDDKRTVGYLTVIGTPSEVGPANTFKGAKVIVDLYNRIDQREIYRARSVSASATFTRTTEGDEAQPKLHADVTVNDQPVIALVGDKGTAYINGKSPWLKGLSEGSALECANN